MFKIDTKPKFLNQKLYNSTSIDDIGDIQFKKINEKLEKLNHEKPEISIVIAAWNEELNIVKCIDSLSKQNSEWPYEIILVDNNSTDMTKEIANKLRVKYLFEPKQGCGPARQLGQENAKGKYILLADADCFYPPDWITFMVKKLSKNNVVCVYGNYSFFRNNIREWFVIRIYEFLRNIMKSVRHHKRPFLNCLGMSMGYIKDLGLKVGFINKNIRGDDGRLAYELMNFGKIEYVSDKKAKVWTGLRTLRKEGGLYKHIRNNIKKELSVLGEYLVEMEDHDPKSTLSKENYSAKEKS